MKAIYSPLFGSSETLCDWIDFLKAAKEEFSQLDPDTQRDCRAAATALVKLHLLDDSGRDCSQNFCKNPKLVPYSNSPSM